MEIDQRENLIAQNPGLILAQALVRNEASEKGRDSFELALEMWEGLDQCDRDFADELVASVIAERSKGNDHAA